MHLKFQKAISQRELFELKASVNWRQSNLPYFRRGDWDISINRRLSGRPKRWNGAFFMYHFPLPSRSHLLWYLCWLKTKPGPGIPYAFSSVSALWAFCISTGSSLVTMTEQGTCACRKKKAQQSNPLNVRISWLHPQLSSKHFYTVMKGNWAWSIPNAEKKSTILLAQRFRPRLTKVTQMVQWAMLWLKAFSKG